MNWTSPHFDALAAHHDILGYAWAAIAAGWLGYLLLSLGEHRAIRHRLAGAGLFALAWDMLMPERPLAFLDGRVADLGGEVILVAALALAGLVGVLASLRRTHLHRLAPSVAALAIALLSVTYHVVLINGIDRSARDAAARDLAKLQIAIGDALCDMEEYTCGSAPARTGQAAFDADIADYAAALKAAGGTGATFGSNGTLDADPSYIFSIVNEDGETSWVRSSWQDRTDGAATAFFGMSLISVLFWSMGALLTEALHGKARSKRRSRSFGANGPGSISTS